MERRGGKQSKPKTYKCVYCGRAYSTPEKVCSKYSEDDFIYSHLTQAKFCGSNSVLTGGCRPVGS